MRNKAPASKYRAKSVVIDGYRFDSKREAARYQELKILHDSGEIIDLKLQPKYTFPARLGPLRYTESNRVVTYIADFSYVDCHTQARVVEDVKGYDTPLSKLKRALMSGLLGIYVQLI